MKHIIRITAIVLVILTVLLLCACGKGGKKAGRPTTYDGENSVEALVDYAKRLEEMGADKAAAMIYDMLPDAARGELFINSNKIIEENECFEALESLEDAQALVEKLKEASK